MSTIVVVKKGGRACIAADTLTSFGDQLLPAEFDLHHNKIQCFGDTYWGVVGSAAHSLVLENHFSRAKQKQDFSCRAGIFDAVLSLHRRLKEKYFLVPNDHEDDPYESMRLDALLMNSKGIFGVYALREVYEYPKYWAIGVGSDYALGAMHALYDRLESPEEIATQAIEAAAKFDNATALPVTLQSVELE